jgi:hypothetical protein
MRNTIYEADMRSTSECRPCCAPDDRPDRGSHPPDQLSDTYLYFSYPVDLLGYADMDAGTGLVAICVTRTRSTPLMEVWANYPIAPSARDAHKMVSVYTICPGVGYLKNDHWRHNYRGILFDCLSSWGFLCSIQIDNRKRTSSTCHNVLFCHILCGSVWQGST